LSVDVETKVLNELDKTIHRQNAIIIEHPELGKVMTNFKRDTTYSFDVLNIWSHAYDTRERKVLGGII